MKTHFIVLMFFLLCLGVSAHAADFQKGTDAYLKGDYATALKEFRLAAEQGVVEAQYSLGVMYSKGEGVRQDYKKAGKCRRAAE